ncbi:hypothetical protein HHK36_001433 [Tetracentron sinense]|uniref:60S ribosomal protein L41 n=1 Tax=Tetracentron sinense TaxID=13715 RepID=A0A835DRM7_TETSI|nr:hypothetical protein HHK36_001433 [Tetracentron sinense]
MDEGDSNSGKERLGEEKGQLEEGRTTDKGEARVCVLPKAWSNVPCQSSSSITDFPPASSFCSVVRRSSPPANPATVSTVSQFTSDRPSTPASATPPAFSSLSLRTPSSIDLSRFSIVFSSDDSLVSCRTSPDQVIGPDPAAPPLYLPPPEHLLRAITTTTTRFVVRRSSPPANPATVSTVSQFTSDRPSTPASATPPAFSSLSLRTPSSIDLSRFPIVFSSDDSLVSCLTSPDQWKKKRMRRLKRKRRKMRQRSK